MQSALLVSETCGWPQVNLKTSNGSTALHNAASSGHADVMRLLIAANCNVNIHTLGSASALYNAATGGENASLQTAETAARAVTPRLNLPHTVTVPFAAVAPPA